MLRLTPNAAVHVVVEVDALAERFAAEAPSVVVSEAGTIEAGITTGAAVTSMEAVTGGRASTLVGVIRTIGDIRITGIIHIIGVTLTTTGIIRITGTARIITPLRHRLLNRHRLRLNLHRRNSRNSPLKIRQSYAGGARDLGNSESGGF